MSFAPTSPVTGAPQTGFTTPTYTITSDKAPNVNGTQYAITAVGGTQTGVTVHSGSNPFTTTVFRPANFKVLPAANPVTGVVKAYPVNTFKHVTRKGAVANTNGPYQINRATTAWDIVAGTDNVSPAEIRALASLHIGIQWQQSAGIGDLLVTNLL